MTYYSVSTPNGDTVYSYNQLRSPAVFFSVFGNQPPEVKFLGKKNFDNFMASVDLSAYGITEVDSPS